MGRYEFNYFELAERFREIRQKMMLSQENMANLLGVGKSAVSKYESGEAIPKLKVLLKYREYGRCTMDKLLFGINDKVLIVRSERVQGLQDWEVDSLDEIEKLIIELIERERLNKGKR